METLDVERAASLDQSTPREWLDDRVKHMFRVMHSFEQDNFDANRYRGQAPNAFHSDWHAAYFSFVLANVDRFHAARSLLADARSRALFDELILYRIMSHLHVRLSFDAPATRRHVATAESWEVMQTEDAGLLGPLSIYLVPDASGEIHAKCWKENIVATWLQEQYYFDRDRLRVAPQPGDHIIDAGACFGDTALRFAAVAGDSGHVYAFDPLPHHCAIVRQNLDMNPRLARRVTMFDVGLAAKDRTGGAVPGGINPGATAFDDDIPTIRLDRLCQQGDIARVDFIKMDIEGSELDALQGAEQALRRHRPRLAISLYHRPEDFFAIPLWIDALGCGYRFHLDHYSCHREETVLYAHA